MPGRRKGRGYVAREHSVKGLARRSEGGGGFKGYRRLCGRPCSKIAFLDIQANQMRKTGVLDRVLKKDEFQWIFDAKIQGPDLVKDGFGRRPVAI